MDMNEMINKEKEMLQEGIDNGDGKCFNLKGFDGSVSLDELFEIRSVIHELLDDYVSGSSIEGNGTNFNFTFNGKPFLLRVQKDDFHTTLWKDNENGYWDKSKNPTYRNGLEVK